MAVRGILASISNISLIAAGFIFIPKMGDAGLGAAYVAYGVCLIALMGVGTCFSSTRYRSTAPVPSMRAIITSSLSFNVQLLAIGFFRLLLDPVSKLLIGTFSGLDLIATFDLASKVTTQVRVMFSSAAQAILPMASRELHGLDGSLQKALRSWNTRISKWSLYVSAGSVMGSGILSMIAFGHVNERFILYFGLLSLANSINTFGLVGYYVDLGSANLAGLLRIHAVMGGENVLLGVLLGWMFGGTGVVVAASIALIHSGLACLSLWLKHENESLVDSLSGLKFEGVVFGVGSAYAYFLIPHISAIGSSAAVCVGLVVLGFLFIWREGNWVMRRRNLAHNDVI
jgi:O-antigen/teichoic acid export membrane protein